MTPNEKTITLNIIKALEKEIEKTPTGELRELLCDVNLVIHWLMQESKQNDNDNT